MATLPAAAAWGRGKKGGLSEYARRVRKHRQNLGKYQEAATVAKLLNLNNVVHLLDKSQHLAAIHKAPADDWQWLTELSEGGRGKKGGLSEYARVVGRDEKSVRKWRDAATVAIKVGLKSEVLLEFTTHLAAIHKAPADDWQ